MEVIKPITPTWSEFVNGKAKRAVIKQLYWCDTLKPDGCISKIMLMESEVRFVNKCSINLILTDGAVAWPAYRQRSGHHSQYTSHFLHFSLFTDDTSYNQIVQEVMDNFIRCGFSKVKGQIGLTVF